MLRARPLVFVDSGIPGCFSDDFACRHVVFLMNLGPWALGRSDLIQSGGSEGAAAPWWLKILPGSHVQPCQTLGSSA